MDPTNVQGVAHFVRRMIDLVPSMTVYWDRDMRCRFASRAFERWLGVPAGALIGRTALEVLGPELFTRNGEHARAALAGEVQCFERDVCAPDGTMCHHLAYYIPDASNGQVRGFIAHIVEVTALKQIQSELHATVRALETEIRARRSIEEKLAQTQQELAAALASIDAGLIATDKDGRVTQLNAAAEKLTGWTQADARSRHLSEVFVYDVQPNADSSLNPLDQMLRFGNFDAPAERVEVVARNGRSLSLEVKTAPAYGDDDSVRGLSIVFRDLSQLLKAQTDSVRLAAIVKSSNDAIIGKSLNGRIVSWNRAAQSMFGYSPDEAIGQSIRMLLPPGREEEETRIQLELARGVDVPAFETRRLTKDGRELEVSVSISPVCDASGHIFGASTIVRDISAKHRAESALREADARLRLALEAAQIGDWDLDLASGVTSWSIRHDRCFGHVHGRQCAGFDAFLEQILPEDRSAQVCGIFAGTPRLEDWTGEFRVRWPDASIHWLRTHYTVQRAGTRPSHVLGIVTDITHQKESEAVRLNGLRLETENQRLLEANRLKNQFLSSMSHELRTPLNAIIGFADLIESGTVNVDSLKHRAFGGHIANSGRKLLAVINDLLDLANAQAGKIEFSAERVDLGALVEEVIDVLGGAIHAKRLIVRCDIDPALGELVLDAARLRQGLFNYLSNAVKFTAEQGHVTVRARPQGVDHFRLEVQDTGIGIAPAAQPRLFTEFTRIDAGYHPQRQGSGLGLALVRRVVEAQGGSVGVHSVPGAGSIFHVVLARVHRAQVPPAIARRLERAECL